MALFPYHYLPGITEFLYSWPWEVSIASYYPYSPAFSSFTAGVINLLQCPLSITLLCDGKTTVCLSLSVWIWTLCSNLFNRPICFPPKTLVWNNNYQNQIFFVTLSIFPPCPGVNLFHDASQRNPKSLADGGTKYNKTIVYLFNLTTSYRVPNVWLWRLKTFWVLLANLQPARPVFELVQSQILFLQSIRASPPRGMKLWAPNMWYHP